MNQYREGLIQAQLKPLGFKKRRSYENKWSNIISDDPNYNPNLSLVSGFSIDQNRGKNGRGKIDNWYRKVVAKWMENEDLCLMTTWC